MPPRGHNESSAQRDTEDTRHRHCMSRSPSVPTTPNGLYRQTCRGGFTIHEKSLYERERKKKNYCSHNSYNKRRRDSVLVIIRSRVNSSSELIRNLPITYFNNFCIISRMYFFHRHCDIIIKEFFSFYFNIKINF